MTDLVFATYNSHKICEIKNLLVTHQAHFPQLYQISIINLTDIGFTGEIPETGDTLEANASMKAWTVYRQCGLTCFADDTGLEVEALGGKPGVHSARYAGEGKSFIKNIDKLLVELSDQSNRNARFRTIIALIINGKEFLFEGIAEGRIINEKRGNEGFGYDPVFVPDGFDQTFAEMTLELKNRISHRFLAIQQLLFFLQQSLPTTLISHH